MADKDLHGTLSHRDVGKAWGELEAVSMTGRTKRVASLALTEDPALFRTSSGSSLATHPLGDCILGTAIVSEEASLHLGPAAAPLLNPRWSTIS